MIISLCLWQPFLLIHHKHPSSWSPNRYVKYPKTHYLPERKVVVNHSSCVSTLQDIHCIPYSTCTLFNHPWDAQKEGKATQHDRKTKEHNTTRPRQLFFCPRQLFFKEYVVMNRPDIWNYPVSSFLRFQTPPYTEREKKQWVFYFTALT